MSTVFNKFYMPAKLTPLGKNVISLCVGTLDSSGTASLKTKNRFGKKAFVGNNCYSISKSIVALALGFLFDEGRLNPNDKAYDYLGEYFPKGFDERWKNVTLNDLFHHKTGADWNVDFDITNAAEWEDKEYLHKLFGSRIAHKTGETWRYCDGNYYILARVFEKVAGKTAYEFLHERLFAPLNFYYDMWATDANGHILGGTGAYIRTEDIAKLGLLWMNKGVYNGVRYISEEWVDLALPNCVNGYGYGIRKMSASEYTITGMYGQGIYINTKKKVVCAWHAKANNGMLLLCSIISKFIR